MKILDELSKNIELQQDCIIPRKGDWTLADFTPTNGLRVHWFYDEDAKFHAEWHEGQPLKDTPPDGWPYSGIIVPIPDAEGAYLQAVEFEDCVVIIDKYPTEKCSPRATWITLAELVDTPGLVTIKSGRSDQ